MLPESSTDDGKDAGRLLSFTSLKYIGDMKFPEIRKGCEWNQSVNTLKKNCPFTHCWGLSCTEKVPRRESDVRVPDQ
jgi:hypothetical protein